MPNKRAAPGPCQGNPDCKNKYLNDEMHLISDIPFDCETEASPSCGYMEVYFLMGVV